MINATSGTLGNLSVTGTLSGGTIIGTNLIGGSININNNAFKVDNNGTVTATNANITGGSITSNSTINVATNATIGKTLTLSSSDYGAGINWGDGSYNSIFIDPASHAVTIRASNLYVGANQVLTTASTIYAKFA